MSSRKTLLYNVQGVAIGPAPNTGYHFMRYDGKFNNDPDNYPQNHDLVMDLSRVQSVAYSFTSVKQQLSQLGKRTLVSRPIIDFPEVDVSVTYLLMGLKNEARLGFNVNYPQYEYPKSGDPYYDDNFSVSLLRRLIGRTLDQPTGDPFWPHPDYSDKRNIFVAIGPQDKDLIKANTEETAGVGFGNCYLTSYSMSAAVGDTPTSTASFVCENMNFVDIASGAPVPTVNAKDRRGLEHILYNLPDFENNDGQGISVLKPGDISIRFTSPSDIEDIGIGLSSECIQSFSLGIDFERQPLDQLAYRLPVDRQINFPVIASIDFSYLIGNHDTGALVNILNDNDRYDIVVEMKHGCVNDIETVIRIDAKQAQFDSVSYSDDIGRFKNASVSFSVEIDPDDFNDKNLFVSGKLNIDKTQNFLLSESGNYLTDDSGNRIVTNLIPLY